MRLIVQKYGGTSVGSAERIRNVAKRIVETQREDCRVVAIISAMAGVTDELIKLAHEMSPDPDKRELDVLLATGENAASALTAMAVNALGARAISLTGAEAGILTDRIHTKARIANISPKQIQELLADDYIVVVAGFQGQSAEGEITTLGRGGSDLTAIALAGALNADAWQTFTDVDGVFTTDLSFTIHESDLEAATKLLKPIVKQVKASGLITSSGVAKLSVVGIGMRSHSGVAARLFDCLGKAGINIQLISTSEIKIAVVIDEADVDRAAQLTHAEFGLGTLAPVSTTLG